jgi:F-type H+-transporting ATPase subunit b
MLIDWFTVAAQAVNFLILAWLLKRFLYGPIIAAMQERREGLAHELNQTREARTEADRHAEELSKKREDLEKEAQAMLTKARAEADERREQWLKEAKTEVEERSQAWIEAVEREQAAMGDRMRHRIGEQVVRLSEKVLQDLAGDELEARALADFISRLARSDVETQVSGDVTVRTGFPLSENVLDRLETAIREHFPDCGKIETIEDDSIGFGIVMVGGDTKWEWNLASYMDDVESVIFAELAETRTETS